MSSEKMKAIVCTKYDPPDVLHLKEVDKPALRDNEVLAKVHATTVTSADVRLRSFTGFARAKVAYAFALHLYVF